MEIEYPISTFVHGQLCLKNAPEPDCTFYPSGHLPMLKHRKIDPKKVAEVIRDLGSKYPSGLWCVKFPISDVEIDGDPATPLHAVNKTLADNIAQHAAGLLISKFLNMDDVSTDEDGVTVYEKRDRYGVVHVAIEFSIGSATSKCVDKVAEIITPWLD